VEPRTGTGLGCDGAIVPFLRFGCHRVPSRMTMDAAAVLMGDIVRCGRRQAGPRSLPMVTVQSSRALQQVAAALEDEIVVLNMNDSEYYGSNGIDAFIKQPVEHPKRSLRLTV
jgi:hypothetical protein